MHITRHSFSDGGSILNGLKKGPDAKSGSFFETGGALPSIANIL